MRTSRELDELRAQNIIHPLNEAAIRHNYDRLIARLFARELELWLPWVHGRRILEVGASCGQVTRLMRERGLEVTPIDIDPDAIALALELTGIRIDDRSVYELEPTDGPFDLALLRDVVSHLEPDRWIERMAALKVPQVMVIDSNLDNPLLQLSRKIVKHEEHEELSLEELSERLNRHGYRQVRQVFREFVAWPLSGGLMLRQPLPAINALERLVVGIEAAVDAAMTVDAVRERLGWRYCCLFERTERPS